MNMRTLAVYGAGNKALDLEEILYQYNSEVSCVYAIENKQFSKVGGIMSCKTHKSDSLKIISTNELKYLYAKGKIDGVVFPTTYHLFDWNEIYEICINAGVREDDIYAVSIDVLRHKELINVSLDEILVPYKKLLQIYHLDIHILDKCNIKCKGCAHFATLADEDMIEVDEYEKNLMRLKELIPNICEIAILGGEPLLHPQLCEILEITKKIYPYANIACITNGILLTRMDESLVRALIDNDITISISLYPAFKGQLEKWLHFLNSNNIRYIMVEFNEFERRLWPEPVFDGEKMSQKCGHDLVMKKNHIARCPLSMFVKYYNRRFEPKLPEEKGIDIYEAQNGKELLEYLSKPVALCEYCCARDHCYEAWDVVTDSNMDASDWFMNIPKKMLRR